MKKVSLFIIAFFIFNHCKNTPSNTSTSTSQQNAPLQPSGQSGQALAQLYCGSCHLYPEPALLDKQSWTKELLPNMGARLGIKTPHYDPLQQVDAMDKMMIQTENIYPKTPLLHQEDWDKIVQFYRQEAPEKLTLSKNKATVTPLKNFKIKTTTTQIRPITTLTMVDTIRQKMYVGLLNGAFMTYDKHLNLVNTLTMPLSPVGVAFGQNDKLHILGMGHIHPNESQEGAFFEANTEGSQKLFGNLRRPVQVTNIGTDQWLICEFGYQKGRLSFYTKVNNEWRSAALTTAAGATKALPYDFNKDGLMDVAVLMAQGDEHISIFYNKGKADFEEKQVLRFSPVNGSSDVQVVDFNKDGFMDLLYTNGDNADFSPILKPYHGVHVYLNDGKDNFTEGAFYPMYGAFQAKAADFDLDGDMDIAVIAFFPDDKTKPASHFLYLEQTKPFVFKPYTFKEATQGKWMTMDIGDVDADGDTDILLGSFAMDLAGRENLFDKLDYREKVVPFFFLENTIKK
jgi:FG-GAP-like repeat